MEACLILGGILATTLVGVGSASAAPLRVPDTLDEWEKQREDIRATLWKLLGDLPPRPERLEVKTVKRDEREHYVLEKFEFENGLGATVYGYLCIPKGLTAPAPGILYNHYHGGEYDNGKEEILKEWPVDETPAWFERFLCP